MVWKSTAGFAFGSADFKGALRVSDARLLMRVRSVWGQLLRLAFLDWGLIILFPTKGIFNVPLLGLSGTKWSLKFGVCEMLSLPKNVIGNKYKSL